MTRESRTIDSFMESRRQLIFNAAVDDEIKALVLPFNYDETKIDQGKTTYNNTDTAVEKQVVDYARQFEAKAMFDRAFEEAENQYITYVALFRLALGKDTINKKLLGLDGKRPKKFGSWLRRANRFYNNSIDNGNILPLVAEYGVTNDKLIAGRELVKRSEAANDEHDRAKGTAQQSTKDRNEAMKALDEWASAFKTVCRIALKNRPQLLERLGIVVLSEGYTRKSKDENEEPAAEDETPAETTRTQPSPVEQAGV